MHNIYYINQTNFLEVKLFLYTNLTNDVFVGKSNNHSILWSVVLIFLLNNKAFSCKKICLALWKKSMHFLYSNAYKHTWRNSQFMIQSLTIINGTKFSSLNLHFWRNIKLIIKLIIFYLSSSWTWLENAWNKLCSWQL